MHVLEVLGRFSCGLGVKEGGFVILAVGGVFSGRIPFCPLCSCDLAASVCVSFRVGSGRASELWKPPGGCQNVLPGSAVGP